MLTRCVGWYDFLLFVHVLGAFALLGATAWFWALTIGAWKARRASTILTLGKLVLPATVVVVFGAVVTLVLGISLAIYRDEYEVWDGWIVASIVLWAISSETGRRGGVYHQREIPPLVALIEAGTDEITPQVRAAVPNRTALLLDAVSTVAVLAILVLMIFKPGV